MDVLIEKKNAHSRDYVSYFSIEERPKMPVRWDAKCITYSVTDPKSVMDDAVGKETQIMFSKWMMFFSPKIVPPSLGDGESELLSQLSAELKEFIQSIVEKVDQRVPLTFVWFRNNSDIFMFYCILV